MPNYNYNSFGMSPIRRRNPIGMNVSAFADAVTKLDTKYQQMAQQQSAIDMALAQLPVNAAEDAWRMGLSDEIQQQINSVDNPNDRLLTSIKAAGQIMNRPDVIGRIRAQADYKNFVEQTQKRNDIDQRTKNWAIETNPYNYQDILDSNGRVVGGSEWKPTNTPVANINLASLGSIALQWAKPDKAKGSNAVFIDSNGDFTTDMNKAVDVAYQTEEGYITLGKDKLNEAIEAAINMTPGARESIEQDYNIAEWEYNKLTPKEKATIGETSFTDSNGRPLTRKEFLAKKINPWVNASYYSDKESKITYGNGLSTRMSLKQQAEANAVADMLGNGQVNYTSTGFNITYDTSDYLANAQGNIDDAIRTIEGAMPKIADTKQWQEAKQNGDYLKLESIIRNARMRDGKNYFNATTQQAQKMVNNALRDINNNYSFVSDTFKGTDKRTKDALLFKSAIDAGQKLPDNNENSRAFYGLLNEISGGKPAESYKITFNDKSDVDDFLVRMGMNEATAKQNGLDFGYEDGFTTVTIKQNSNLLPKAVINFFDGNDDFFSLPWNRSRITALDNNGNDIGSSKRGTLLDNFGEQILGGWTTANHFNDLKNIVNAKVDKYNSSRNGLRSTDQLKIADIPALANAKRKYGDDSSEYARAKKSIEDDLALRLSGSDWTQFGVYGYNEDTRGLTIMPNADRGEQMANIIGHIQNGKADIQFATNGIQHGYYVILHEKLDKNGNVDATSKPKVYFISSGVEDEAMREFTTDSNTRAMAEYNRRRSTVGSYRTYTNDNITNIKNENAIINGVLSSREKAVNLIERDKLIDDVVDGIKYREIPINSVEELQTVISKAVQHIAKETNVTDQNEATKIANIIINKIK